MKKGDKVYVLGALKEGLLIERIIHSVDRRLGRTEVYLSQHKNSSPYGTDDLIMNEVEARRIAAGVLENKKKEIEKSLKSVLATA